MAGGPRGVRVKEYNFTVGSLTADANGRFDAYTSHALNGTIKGVAIYESNWTNSAGSLLLNVSGLETTAWSMVSGTVRNTGVADSGLTLPLATTIKTNAVPISGTGGYVAFQEIPMNSVMHLVGSGLGNAKSGLGLAIIYV